MLQNDSEYPFFQSLYELLGSTNEIISLELKKKMEELLSLFNILDSKQKIYVAFSGGVDSSLILKLAYDVLKEKVVAVTGISSSLAENEITIAKDISKKIGVEHIFLNTDEMKNENYLKNPVNRCYYCKSELYEKLLTYIKDQKIMDFTILDGANYDDLQEIRHGTKAAKESEVKSFLQEVKMTKEDIRLISHLLRIPVWNKPSTPCLSSRVAFGEKITLEKLHAIEEAEKIIHGLGIEQVRVRYHADAIARIEVQQTDFLKLLENHKLLSESLKQFCFQYITLDLEGYRRGSLHLLNDKK